MHARNPYQTAPDFETLARFYRPLAQYVQGRSIDFHDDAAQRCLTKALLKRDFNLDLQLQPHRLCPPVPNRLNYVLWIQDIVTELQQTIPFVLGNSENGGKEQQCAVRGLDVGTGASAIYPLLACRLEPTWNFVATELDDESYMHAQKNVHNNGLSSRIRVAKVETSDSTQLPNESVIPEPHFEFDQLFNRGIEIRNVTPATATTTLEGDVASHRLGYEIQFTMCNPPFYSSVADVENSELGKEHSAFGVCTGAPVEMITPGGEAHFVGAMVRESARSCYGGECVDGEAETNQRPGKRQRVGDDITPLPNVEPSLSSSHFPDKTSPRWYTSMLGKMGSVAEVVGLFKKLDITNYAITEFVQGQTRRWAVGWCIGAWRLSDETTRIANPNPTLQRLLPPRNSLHFDIALGDEYTRESLEDVLRNLEGATVAADGTSTFIVSVPRDTWSRSARRKRKREQDADGRASVSSSEAHHPPGLVCAVMLCPQKDVEPHVMEVRWLYGEERSLLESFASHVARKFGKS